MNISPAAVDTFHSKTSASWSCQRKSQEITSVMRINPLGTTIVCFFSQGIIQVIQHMQTHAAVNTTKLLICCY